jgi:DnaJ-class molecular chaperone
MKAAKPFGTKAGDELNEFQAASHVGMSPKLLRWFASYAPKPDSDRKLKVRKADGRLYIRRAELDGFNDWLKLPWPSKAGARPPVPEGIKQEIREEAGGECAICHSNAGSCEAAHIVPVSKSKNNHPENLIWLCSSHHTKFDKNSYGPKPESAKFVGAFKQAMTYYRRALWELQAEITGSLFTVLKACESLNAQLTAASTPEEVAAVVKLAKGALGQVSKMAPTSKTDPDYAAFEAMKPQFVALAKSKTTAKHIGTTLNMAVAVKAEYARRAGYVNCPLCKGTGHYKHEDCPVCGGEAELTKSEAQAVELERYASVECPLCNGSGTFKGDQCPACSGEGEMERRYAEQVDVGDWAKVDCPVCVGTGNLRGEPCYPCAGEGRLERQLRDRIDVRDYMLVDCPLCEGAGTYRGEDCRECSGHRQMERRFAERVEVRDYQRVTCPICVGSGEWNDRPCRACGGEGELDRAQAEQVDSRDYQMVKCPTCRGHEPEFCRTCGGESRIPKFVADEL